MLTNALADLNRPEPPPINDVLTQLPTEALHLLLAWDAAATVGLAPGHIHVVNQVTRITTMSDQGFEVHIKVDASGEQPALIHYPELGYSLTLEPAVAGYDSITHSACSILKAAWYIRYRTDVVTLLPPQARSERIAQGAASIGIETPHLMSLIVWFHALEGADSHGSA